MKKKFIRSLAVSSLIIIIYTLLNGDNKPDGKTTQLKNEINRMEQKISDMEGAGEQEVVQAEIDRLKQELKFATSSLSDESEISQMLKEYSAIGDASGVKFLLFEPEEVVNEGSYEEVPVKLKLKGTYKQITTFFSALARQPRMIRVDELKITGLVNDIGVVMTETEAVVVTYRVFDGV